MQKRKPPKVSIRVRRLREGKVRNLWNCVRWRAHAGYGNTRGNERKLGTYWQRSTAGLGRVLTRLIFKRPKLCLVNWRDVQT